MKTARLGRFVAARTVSMLGDRLAETALPIIILLTTHDALVAGYVTAAGILPTLLFAFPVGHLVDTQGRRRLMLAADAWRAVLALALAAALAPEHPSAALLVAITFLMGCGDVTFSVASHAYLPDLVERTELMRANTALEAGDAASTLAGPSLAGVAIAKATPAVTMGLNALSFAASATLLWRLPEAPPRSAPSPQFGTGAEDPDDGLAGGWTGRSRLHSMTAGIRLLASDRLQRLLQNAYAYMHLTAGSAALVIIAFAVQALNLTSLFVGLLLSAAGVGGLIASLVVARRVERLAWGPLLGASLLGLALSFLGLAATHGFAGAFAAVLVMDGCSAMAFITAGSARQTLTPAPVLGRLTAASGIVNYGVRAVGALGAGAVIAAIGARMASMLIGCLGVLMALPLLVSPVARASLSDPPSPPAAEEPPIRT
jgi:hypothetical protein